MGIKFNTETTYLELPNTIYAEVQAQKFNAPKLLFWNEQLAQELGFNIKDSTDILNTLSSEKGTAAQHSIAQAYAGHQFGYFNILGDGRAVLLGEQISTKGERFDLQLKGSGRTPYSRRGDGLATMYSMLREYLISEAMHGLKIPTTRSLAVISTGSPVYRETPQKGGILARVASSHIRVGTFEYLARQKSRDELKSLADYSIKRHYPALIQEAKSDTLYLDFFTKVMERQIATVVNWIRVGFIHGVMNTDNITISGETIDYGPCAFMNKYDPQTVFSSIDTQGRYAFGNQGRILLWNLARFAEALLPLFNKDEKKALDAAQKLIDSYEAMFTSAYYKMMSEKLGLIGKQLNDHDLVDEFLKWMLQAKADYTNSFVSLAQELSLTDPNLSFSKEAKNDRHLASFLNKWNARIVNKQESLSQMKRVNPRIIPRNHKVEEALLQASDDHNFTKFDALQKALENPYKKNSLNDPYNNPPENEGGYRTYCGT